MFALYGFRVDRVRSSSDVYLANALIDRLPFEPRSRYRAEVSEDSRLYEWGPLVEAQASVVEELRALQALIVNALSDGKGEIPVKPYQLRPKTQLDQYEVETSGMSQPSTLADVQAFLAQM